MPTYPGCSGKKGCLLTDVVVVFIVGVFSESTEYSDWEPDGINLQPPRRRSQRKVTQRRWSSLDASESSDSEDDGLKGRAKTKPESDDETHARKSIKTRSRTRSQKKVAGGKHKKQVFITVHHHFVSWKS